MGNSRDPRELEHVWLSWRDHTGKKMRTDYIQFVRLINEAAKLNGRESRNTVMSDNLRIFWDNLDCLIF